MTVHTHTQKINVQNLVNNSITFWLNSLNILTVYSSDKQWSKISMKGLEDERQETEWVEEEGEEEEEERCKDEA